MLFRYSHEMFDRGKIQNSLSGGLLQSAVSSRTNGKFEYHFECKVQRNNCITDWERMCLCDIYDQRSTNSSFTVSLYEQQSTQNSPENVVFET